MTLNLSCCQSDDCFEDIDCIPALELSEEATKEILNDNLSALIAIGKDCKPVLFMPFGNKNASNCDYFLDDEDSKTLFEITIRIPKHSTIKAKKYCVCYPLGGKPPYGCWK